MKIQKLQAKIDAGVCTDCDIQTYLEGLAIAPILSAEARYLGLMAQDDVLDVAAVTEERNVLVSEAYSANTERDTEIAALVLDYPHLVEPEQTYAEVERSDDEGLIYFETVPDVMPTMIERRPLLVLSEPLYIDIMTKAGSAKIQAMLNATAQRNGYDDIDTISKYLGYDNQFRSECEALSMWTAECWAKGIELLSTTEAIALSDVITAMPIYGDEQ
jgi:hypothetical protein